MLPQIQGAESREFIRFASIRQSRGSSWNFGARNSFRLTARSPDSGKSSQSLTIRQGQTEVRAPIGRGFAAPTARWKSRPVRAPGLQSTPISGEILPAAR